LPIHREVVRVIQALTALALCGVLTAFFFVRHDSAASTSRVTPAIRAQGLHFAPSVSAYDRRWILAAEHEARPEAARLLDEVDGLVTIYTMNAPGAPWVGIAESDGDKVVFNVAYLDGDRQIDRDTAVLHELGHIIDYELIGDDEIDRLAGEVPTSGVCFEGRADCANPKERFADTFAKWALRGNVSITGSGYQLASPASLEDWGRPLAALAVQLDVEAARQK
jgi:hypothetical protein